MNTVESKYLEASGITHEMIEETLRRLDSGEYLYQIASDMKLNIPTLSFALSIAANNKVGNVRKKSEISQEVVNEAIGRISGENLFKLAKDLGVGYRPLITAIKNKTGKTINELREKTGKPHRAHKRVKETVSISQEMIDTIVRRLELGEKFKDMAKEFGVGHRKLNAMLRTMTGRTILEHRTKTDPISMEMLENIIERLRTGESFIAIAKSIGIETNALHRKFLLQTGRTAYQMKKMHIVRPKKKVKSGYNRDMWCTVEDETEYGNSSSQDISESRHGDEVSISVSHRTELILPILDN